MSRNQFVVGETVRAETVFAVRKSHVRCTIRVQRDRVTMPGVTFWSQGILCTGA